MIIWRITQVVVLSGITAVLMLSWQLHLSFEWRRKEELRAQRKDETRKYRLLAHQLMLQTRCATMEELHALHDVKEEAA